jgi:hypothetical protein
MTREIKQLIIGWLLLTTVFTVVISIIGSWLFGSDVTLYRVGTTFGAMAMLFGLGTLKTYAARRVNDD